MKRCRSPVLGRSLAIAIGIAAAAALGSCGGGSTGTDLSSGTNKTYLSVAASDADGDALQYQWRVTSGSIDNKNASQVVWTMPDGPGLHFAYVAISDGKGGWAEQQYAVSSDALGTTAPTPAPVTNAAPAVADFDGSMLRLRFFSSDATRFAPPDGSAAQARIVYLPGVQVQVVAGATIVFAGRTDLAGEVALPKLASNVGYSILCSTQAEAPLVPCGAFTGSSAGTVETVASALSSARNLRLFGHVALADGGVCGHENAFFGILSAASVQLRAADGTAIGSPVTVNRFGDYELDAAVPVQAALKAEIQCEGYDVTLDVPASSAAAGYISSAPVELSHVIANSRPQIVNMIANGPDGNVRGRMVVPLAGSVSVAQPGAEHFLIYKGQDTKLSACIYYRSLGAVQDCDAQGNMISPISFSDWKAGNGFGTAADVSATYINQRDLNLVRRMVATRSASGTIAFYVCNGPGPDGTSQAEIDQLINNSLGGLNLIACVAMEWSPSTGANGGQPFTKFFTFGPDGSLLLSINLDTRGEKYMPGSCVACHGGSTYNGRFPEQASGASPYLGARFLPFDTGNYFFSSTSTLTESAQTEAFYQLNQLVQGTEPSATTPTSQLIQGWYASSHVLDKSYVPPAWLAADVDPATPGAATFYSNVVAISCRTCHVSLGARFDWNSIILSPARAGTQFCGGSADVALNASMPNALISNDRLSEHLSSDAALAAVVTQFLGCSAPLPDPVYPKR
jgi:hypothetical protein